ncbi:unnamed protein product, partial [Didymodactylos carnosus]
IIFSPNWPNYYKPQTLCSNYFLGLDDRYTLEIVEIEFEQFNINCALAYIVLYNCSRIYDHKQSLTTTTTYTSSYSNYYRQTLDFKPNLTFCGIFKPEGKFVSKSALLKIDYIPVDRNTKSSLKYGGRFQANYRFIRSYHYVSADEYDSNPSLCNLSYYQTRSIQGKFEPPRSSDNDYFSRTNCSFNFYPLIMNDDNIDNRVLIWYDYFNIADIDTTTCTQDNLTYSFKFKYHTQFQHHNKTYCGYRNFPAPYLSYKSISLLRLEFRTNDDNNGGLGFDGRYKFINKTTIKKSIINECSSPFENYIYINENDQQSGNILSPNYPNSYPEQIVCEWKLKTNPGYYFSIIINSLDLEGSLKKDPPIGCQTSVLRIIHGHQQIDNTTNYISNELCGNDLFDDDSPHLHLKYHLTFENWFIIQFITLSRSTKEQLKGFNLTWTLLKEHGLNETYPCLDNFDCGKMCISSTLICDGYINCEPFSKNDELNCENNIQISFIKKHSILFIIVFILCIIMFWFLLLFILLVLRTKRKRKRQTLSSANHTNSNHINNDNKITTNRREDIDIDQKQKKKKRSKKNNSQSYIDTYDWDKTNMLEENVTTV